MTTETKDSTGVVVTAVATPVPDIESQKQQQQAAASAAADSSDDEKDGKRLGIAMFVLLLVAFIFNFILPQVSFLCIIIVVFIASTITGGCCCDGDYNLVLKPHVKRWSTATLLCVVLMLVVQIIGFEALAGGFQVSNTGNISQSTVDGASVGVVVLWALSIVLNFLAMIFSAIFTWGRVCGAPIIPLE